MAAIIVGLRWIDEIKRHGKAVTNEKGETSLRNVSLGHLIKSEVIKETQSSNGPSLSEVAADAEKSHIVIVLKSTQGNKTKAAELLGISRKTLWEKMNAYGMGK